MKNIRNSKREKIRPTSPLVHQNLFASNIPIYTLENPNGRKWVIASQENKYYT